MSLIFLRPRRKYCSAQFAKRRLFKMKMDRLNFTLLMLSTTSFLLSFSTADNVLQNCHDGGSGCPTDWSHLSTGQCVKVENEIKDYDAAQTSCQYAGAHLPDSNMTEVLKCIERNNWIKKIWLQGDSNTSYRKRFNFESKELERELSEEFLNYACVMKNKEYKHLSTTLHIQSNGQDVWTSASDGKTSYITHGQPYTLICESQGAAPAILNLSKNGKTVAYRPLSSSNKIVYNSTNTDECKGQRMNFTCKAENTIESVNSSVEVMTQCPSKIVSFNISTTSDISDDKSKEGSYYVGNSIKFNCTAEGHPTPQVIIRRKKDNSVIGLGTESSVTTLNKVDCEDMETYICETRQLDISQESREISFGIHGCRPRLCHTKDQEMITLELGKRFSLCVFAYPQLSDTASFNDRMVPRGHSHPHFTWDYRDNDEFSSYTVTFTIQNMTSSERLNITLFTSEGKKLELNYSILLGETTTHSALATPLATGDPPSESKDDSSSIPLGGLIALVVVITVMVVVTFFILGIFIFRYRRKYKLRKRPQSEATLKSYHSEPANHYQNKDEMELYSTATVNVYANLGHAGNQTRESQFMDAPRERYQPTGLTPAETAKDNTYQNARAFSLSTTCLNTSVNVYANTRDIARMRERGERPHSVPEQERLCPENGDTLYGNTEPGGNAEDTGRHRTQDGLLYVTVAHTVHSGSNGNDRRPAHSEDPAVHYAALDYKKTGTHSAKKWKRKKRFSLFK